jgi:hypothetical protein
MEVHICWVWELWLLYQFALDLENTYFRSLIWNERTIRTRKEQEAGNYRGRSSSTETIWNISSPQRVQQSPECAPIWQWTGIASKDLVICAKWQFMGAKLRTLSKPPCVTTMTDIRTNGNVYHMFIPVLIRFLISTKLYDCIYVDINILPRWQDF